MICIYGARLQTLVNDIVGNDTPTKKPKTTPTMAAIMSFIASLGFLIFPLQDKT
jgi:hypothetical protein